MLDDVERKASRRLAPQGAQGLRVALYGDDRASFPGQVQGVTSRPRGDVEHGPRRDPLFPFDEERSRF